MKKYIFGYFPLVILAYLIPYTLLQKVHKFYGSFLFWIGYTLIVIYLMKKMMDRWKNEN
ncbi:MAG TPA: hypothetical protein PLK24_09435 [Atribacter sp.]|jgi:hypothetical protein|uniref:hypothetical protein n=1 Tax=Atribacter sp. TaxID=2847780 RepID=UPI002BD72DDC|nr:hypothetical protein [Atribacter sp.]HOT05049.1 hypothetical protein [Atribacter sp.]HQK84147.1 hypothetical protein [Atribacter sp.]